MRTLTKRWIFLLTASLVLSACTIGGAERNFRVLAPQLDTIGPGDQTPLEAVLSVARPQADRTRDSRSILVRRGRSLMPWAGVAWNDRAPDLVQDLLVDALDGRVATVGRHGALVADHRLDMELRRFELVEEGGSLEAELELTVRLLDRFGVIVDTIRIGEREATGGGDVEAAVAAMETALERGFGTLAEWLRERLPGSVQPVPGTA
ncbi:hypothetical protein G4Y73_02005 [Wenzhouxiangella sp. XN201]|uniref:ABC-type transport auxiliary lipoprotein family protein n=1 Tax=Wenzhouxiangella sp. XN201 TaxID=2710755 RepID=UPI0013C6FE8C|nr:ABC-type transport auxiliary lipoprotein family protein [Wenzhouxiangella sp. XN201]NEZ02920.1 hypothetical protein [Wenzhouxiangella sp. XN201]